MIRIFGILNITADSFSDGGRFLAPEAARAQARALFAGGAQAIDLGAAASNPTAEPVAPNVEIARLAPVVATLAAEGVPVSIDSFAPEVQAWALAQGVAYLNDIQGFPEPALDPLLAASRARLIVMHSVQGRGRAEMMDVSPDEILARITDFFEGRIARLTAAGVARERLILDPGMGFFLGRDPETSFTVLRGLAGLKARFGLPLLVSVSRKSFVRAAAGVDVAASGAASRAAELAAVANGADMIRTHDPRQLSEALRVWERAAPRSLPR